MEKKARLGRGLDALLSSSAGTSILPFPDANQVALDQIEQNPYQPRHSFDPDELSSLSESIRAHGVLQPIVVRQVGDHYQLVAGERRLRAAKAAGLDAVPVRIVDFDDQQVLEAALVENIQRSDLNPIEKALGFKEHLDSFGMTHEQLATRLGLARTTITNLVNLLELPAEIQDAVRTEQLTTGHAKLLKGVSGRERQLHLCKEIIARGLSVHATEALIKQPPDGKAPDSTGDSKAPVEKTAHVQGIEDELRQKLGTRVEIRLRGPDRGQIVLGFGSNDDFERLLEVLRQ
jgi:ParB family transcriptional regulator, chromosome partitioning protein